MACFRALFVMRETPFFGPWRLDSPRESRMVSTLSCSVEGAGVGERETERVMNIFLDNRWRLMSRSTLSM